MELLSVIRRWHHRDRIPIREIERRTVRRIHADLVALGYGGSYALAEAFRVLGGVPRSGIFDNMRTAADRVGTGKVRQVDARFAAMASHLLLEPIFCSPASFANRPVSLGLFASALPLTLYLGLVQRARTTDAAMTGYLQPGFAALFAALLPGEWPEARGLAGGAIILAGLWLATGRPRGG